MMQTLWYSRQRKLWMKLATRSMQHDKAAVEADCKALKELLEKVQYG